MRHSITLPLLGVMALLMRWQTDKDINLGSVHRTMHWCWDTWRYTAPKMTNETYILEVQDLLKKVDAAVNDIPWEEVKYKEDMYGELVRLVEEAEWPPAQREVKKKWRFFPSSS